MGIVRTSCAFIVGTISGVYITQNYSVPNIKTLANCALSMAKNVEENYRKPKKKKNDRDLIDE